MTDEEFDAATETFAEDLSEWFRARFGDRLTQDQHIHMCKAINRGNAALAAGAFDDPEDFNDFVMAEFMTLAICHEDIFRRARTDVLKN